MALWCAHADANASPRASVHVELDACLGTWRAEIYRVMQVELGGAVSTAPDPFGERTHANISCDGPVAVLRVDDPSSQRSVWRRITFSVSSDTAQPRMLALALVELVASSSTELSPQFTALAEPRSPEASAGLDSMRMRGPLENDPDVGYRATVTGGALTFSADDTVLPGIGVRIAPASASMFGWMLDAQVHRGSEGTSLGLVTTDVLAMGAAAQLRRRAGRARAELGVGLRAGMVRMSGMAISATDARGMSFWSPWFGAFGLGDLAVSLTDRLSIDASAEVGQVLSPVRAIAGSQQTAAVDGVWLQLHLGIVVLL